MVLVFGVGSLVVSLVLFMPIPGNDNTHICTHDTNVSIFRSLAPLGNIPCGENEQNECCDLAWCKEQAAMTVPQFVIAFIIFATGHPFRVALTQSIFSKILGPAPQVHQHQLI